MSPGMNQCHCLNGSSAAGQTLTVTMLRMGALVEMMSGAVCVTGRATISIRLEDAAVAETGRVWNTWFHRHAWMDTFQCAPSILNSSKKWTATSHGFNAFGHSWTATAEAWLLRPMMTKIVICQPLVVKVQPYLCRPDFVMAWLDRPWWKPVARIGEAKNPGPLVCTCNTGGWSRAEGLLSMGHDLILLQETFLLQAKIPGAVRMATEMAIFAPSFPLGVPRDAPVEG
eukprot:1475124-Amphidinium_carterae.1